MSRFFLVLSTKPRFADAPAAPAAPSAPLTPTATPSTPSSTPSSAATPSAAPASPPATGGGFDFRGRLSGLGIDSSKFKDDNDAWTAFENHARQLQAQQQFAQVGQQVMPHLSEFQKWQKQQADVAATEAAKQKKSWWQPPEWNEQWMESLDENGQVKPGHDPAIGSKIAAFRKFQRDTFAKFTQNPIEMLKPGLEEFVKEQALTLIKEHLGGFQSGQEAKTLIQRNSGWIYEQEGGGIKLDPQGRQILSIAGQWMHKHLMEMEEAGVKGQQAWDWAVERTQATLYKMKEQQPPVSAAPAVPAIPAAPVDPAAGVNRLQNIDTNGQQNRSGVPRKGKPNDLAKRMLADLDRAGIQSLN